MVIVTGLTGGTTPAFAATNQLQENPEVRGRLRLVSQTPVIGEDGTFSLSADYVAPGDEPIQVIPQEGAPEIEVAIAVYQRVTDREALLDSIQGVRLGSPIALRTQPLDDPIPKSAGINIGEVANRRVTAKLQIGKCTGCLPISTDGVYPVSVDVRQKTDATVNARLITHMLVQRGTGATPLRVALIVPMTGERTLQIDGTRRTTPLTRIVAASESLASQPGVPLSVVLTPSLVDAARTDVSIAGTLDTLGSGLAGREIIAPTYEAMHPRLQHDGRLGEIITGQWRQGIAVLRERFGDAVVEDTWLVGPDDELPDRDGLLKVAPQRLVVHAPLVAADWSSEPKRTVDRPNKRPPLIDSPVVFDTGIVFSADSKTGKLTREDALEESSPITSVITDDSITDHLRTDDPLLGVSNLLADLTIAAATASPTEGLAVSVPNQAVRRDVLDQLLAGIRASRSIEPVRVSELFTLPISVTPTGEYRSIGRVVRPKLQPVSDTHLNAIDATRRRIDGVATMTVTPESLSTSPTLADRLFSAALADPDAGTASHNTVDPEVVGQTFLDAARRTSQTTLSGVKLGPGGPFRLTALRGPIGIRIDNATGGPVTVHLSVEKGRVRLSTETSEQDVVVDQASQVIKLDVETRSSGTFDIRVALTTPNGVPLSQNAYTIQSTGVSGIGVTLTLVLLVLLVLWWLRTRSKTRAAKAASPQS